MRREENRLKELEALQKLIPFVPSATSYGMSWKALQAVRYRNMPDTECSSPPVSLHRLVWTIRPPKKYYLQCEELKRDEPLTPGSIAVLPKETITRHRWQGNWELLVVYLEPSIVARVVAESFGFVASRTVLPPLCGLNVPELRSAMLAVDAELRIGGVGGSLLVESLANVLAVHLIRHITGSRRELASADGVLPRHKLRRVIEYIMENL